MNLTQALDAVPELPAQIVARQKLKLDPGLIVREELDENGAPVAVIFAPQIGMVYRVPLLQYQLLQLFDGTRSFAEIAEAFQEQTGAEVSTEQVRELAQGSQDSGLWYRSAQERNITLSQKLAEERRKRIRRPRRKFDLAHTDFKAWDPDKYLKWLDERVGKVVYSGWFALCGFAAVCWMLWVWIDRWGQVSRDSVLFYTLTKKSGGDLLEFWILFLMIAFFHESAHGLTARHYGAEVHSMGLQLIYLTPAFSCDITQVWVRTTKWQRVIAIMAGIVIEMYFCALATFIWWGTAPGTFTNGLAYKVMLITGIMVVVLNINPLIKLDGYYALAEVVGIPELKERSTAFASGWVKEHLWRLPVEYDYVPPGRRWLYVPYALISGAYTYLILYAVVRFSFNVFSHFLGDWAFAPAVILGWFIFRSRLKRLGAFMKTLYLHNRPWLQQRGWAIFAVASLALLVLLFAPMWRETARGVLVLEPVRKAVLRSEVAGQIAHVYAREGMEVAEGAPVIELTNPDIESTAARAKAELELARANRTRAQLKYISLGTSQSELARSVEVDRVAKEQLRALQISAPISGTVVTPRPADLQGESVAAGTVLAEIDDVRMLRARLYVPEFEMRDIKVGALVAIRTNSVWQSIEGRVDSIAIAPAEADTSLLGDSKYEGLKPPTSFLVSVVVANNGLIRPGMRGEAKVMVTRRSLAGFVLRDVLDFVTRRVW